jgi:hypothetical protein
VGFRESHYQSGEKICPGDRITWAGRPGRVIFVLGSTENSPVDGDSHEWLAETETGGFMLEVEGVGRVFEHNGDEDLTLEERRG